jgi:hypothetical protein
MAEFVIRLRAYFRGSQDYKRGVSVSDNPYPPGPLVRHWIDGWLLAWLASGYMRPKLSVEESMRLHNEKMRARKEAERREEAQQPMSVEAMEI